MQQATASTATRLTPVGNGQAEADEFDTTKWVTFNAQLCVLICVQCGSGIRPGSSVERHFRKVHKVTGKALREIVDFGLGLEPLADPHDVPLPADGEAPVEELIVQDGFECLVPGCGYRTISQQLIYTHGSEHKQSGNGKWVNSWACART